MTRPHLHRRSAFVADLAVVVVICAVAACGSSTSEPPATPALPTDTDPSTLDPAGSTPPIEIGNADEPAPGAVSPAATATPEPGVPGASRPMPCPPQSTWPEGMACVLGGTFILGDERGRPDEQTPGEVYVDTFFMDTHEVTNGAYERCIEAGLCERPMRFRHFMGERQPVVAVSWFDAVHHCEMIGRRLPTDAEWERAASGPDHTRYPWGDEPAGCDIVHVKTDEGEGCGTGVTLDVGSLPAGHFGLFDMAGNVHEWVQDHYSPCLRGCDRECGDACFGDNPRGPCGGEAPCPGFGMRSVRGGSWYWPLERARASARRGSGAPNRGPHRFGFRCARDLIAPAAVDAPASEAAGPAAASNRPAAPVAPSAAAAAPAVAPSPAR